MRFIRKNGRVIPIRDKNEARQAAESHRARGDRKVAASGVLDVATAFAGKEAAVQFARARALKGAGNLSGSAHAFKLSRKYGVATIGIQAASLGLLASSLMDHGKAAKVERDAGIKSTANDMVSRAGKTAIAYVTGLIGTKLAVSGLMQGASAARPSTKRFAEWRRFRRAKTVPNFRPVAGALR